MVQLAENNSSFNNNSAQISVLASSLENTDNFNEKDLNEIPDAVLLNVQKNDMENNVSDKSQNLQFVLHAEEMNMNNINHSQFIEVQENATLETDSKTYNINTIDDQLNLLTSENDSQALSKPDLIGSNDSDSDWYKEVQDNTLGSLNDTITKIKEIKNFEGDVVQYQCVLCLENHKELSEVLNHIVNLHVPKTGPFYCVVCEIDCSSMKELKTHIAKHTGPSPYICFLCNKSYVRKRYLKRHMACHTDFPRHRCAKCGDRFKVKTELDDHILSHTDGEAPYSCSQCPRKFNHKGNYKRHLISHLDPNGLHLPKFPCNICNKRFINNRTLTSHIRIHTGEKPFKCDVCNKTFSQQANLFNHNKIHENARNYTCEVCGKSFNQKVTLRDHSRLHSGEKPYVCSVCGLAYTFSAALRRHMWSHSKKKPFECDTCNAKFVAKYDLLRHLKSHNGKPKHQKSNKKAREQDVISFSGINIVEDPSQSNTILVEQILLCDDSIQIISEDNMKKENVDALLRLM